MHLRFSLVLVLVHLLLWAHASTPFKHVVVLMMENHSFDNMLGWLPGIGDLTGKEYNLANPSNSSSQKFFVGRNASYCTYPDPDHSFLASGTQVYAPQPAPVSGVGHPTMGGFSADFISLGGNGQDIMECYTPQQVPVISALATEFRVFTNWYASLPGPTGPNRLFVHTATSGGYDGSVYDGTWPLQAASIQDQLSAENLTWAIHYNDFTTAHGISPMNEHTENFHQDVNFDLFFKNLDAGELTNYTFLVPLLNPIPGNPSIFPNTQHPFYDIRPGELLMKEVYERLRNSTHWEDTLFLITYDEHGGFWDSRPPPATVSPNASAAATPYPFAFNRLGIRVPTIAISPWIPKSSDDSVYDHCSVPATIRQIFNLTSEPLSDREKISRNFAEGLLSSPRTDTPTWLAPPPTTPPHCTTATGVNGLSQDMARMYQELLQKSKLAKVPLSKRFEDLRDDSDAGVFMREAARLLEKTKMGKAKR